jgi:hypothetical protein
LWRWIKNLVKAPRSTRLATPRALVIMLGDGLIIPLRELGRVRLTSRAATFILEV